MLLLNAVCKQKSGSRFSAVDVGGHYGEYARFLLELETFDAVISFEPNPESYACLLKSVSSSDNCRYEAVNIALGSKSERLNLYCDGDSATASLLKYEQNYISRGEISKREVAVQTMDEYFYNKPLLSPLKLLKIDTQGNDLDVIRGARDLISTNRPIIQTEFIYVGLYENQCTPDELKSELSEIDYEMYSLNNLHVTPEGRLAFCDAIFVPRELDVPIEQKFSCIDDQESFKAQIEILSRVCAERLDVINVLDAEVKRLRNL